MQRDIDQAVHWCKCRTLIHHIRGAQGCKFPALPKLKLVHHTVLKHLAEGCTIDQSRYKLKLTHSAHRNVIVSLMIILEVRHSDDILQAAKEKGVL